jgi:phosphate-selective porin OprO/OprP
MKVSEPVRTGSYVAALLVAALPAAAQSPRADAAAVVRWNNGVSIESPDGNNVIQLGTIVQMDGRFSDSANVTDTFFLRRARIIAQGRVARFFEFIILPDFGNGGVVVQDAYAETRLSSAFRIRAGKSKTPVGLEQLYSDAGLPNTERSLATNLAPNRDIGVLVLGNVFANHLSYIGGVVNGVPDAANGDADTNDSKDLVVRVTIRLGPIGAAVGASHGSQIGPLPGFRTGAQQLFFSYRPDVAADGMRNRVSPSAFIYYKSVGGFAEYVRNTQAVTARGVTTDIVSTAWNVTGIIVATGERLSDSGSAPVEPFEPANGRWGALQLTGRVSSVRADPQAFELGFAAPGASRTATSYGVAATWYNTPNIKHVLSYERTIFDGDGDGRRNTEHAVIFRVQLNLAPVL